MNYGTYCTNIELLYIYMCSHASKQLIKKTYLLIYRFWRSTAYRYFVWMPYGQLGNRHFCAYEKIMSAIDEDFVGFVEDSSWYYIIIFQ
jgi:hypothetical protein